MKARMRDVLGKAKKEHYAVPANMIDWNCAKHILRLVKN